MILLLGSTGYIGNAFQTELTRRGEPFVGLSRSQVDYTRFTPLYEYLKTNKPSFVINAAGFTGKPNVDACEAAKADTLQGNTLFPQALAHACTALEIPFGHVSSGCIFTGAWVDYGNGWVVEKDMTKPEFKAIAASNPEKIRGFDETMTPNFSFRDQPCSFYSGSKALAEEAVTGDGQNFIWRLRIPFDEFDSERNYITKLQRYGKVYSNFNSLTHRMDFVKACLDCWQQKVPFGIYNITNPGHITGKEVIQLIKEYITPKKKYVFFSDDHEFYSFGAKAQRSNCILDSKKIQQSGVYMRNVTEALIDAVSNWKKI